MFKWLMILCLIFTGSLSAQIKVLAFSGSTRQDSLNKKLLSEAVKLARQQGAQVTLIDLKDYPLPFYDGDLESKEGMPAKVKEFRNLMIQSSVIFISSPNYNGSISAVLKNALDWASRGEDGKASREAFKGKKFLIMSASPGKTGGVKGLGHLRSIIENVGGTVVQEQVSLGNAHNAFDNEGHLKDEKTKEELEKAIKAALEDNQKA